MKKLLVANRGEIAVRIFHTAARMGIGTVAVFSETDRDTPFVAAADQAMALGGASPTESYLRADAVIAAALRSGADAIHPGYGFLAENADFARAVSAAGLTWVGPGPEAIEVMGSKLRSKEKVSGSGVPVLPSIDVTDGDAHSAADEIGYPVLIKASAGGGGKGMRIVADPEGLTDAVAGAKREAASAFGDETVFLEKYLVGPRHIEIQVFADHSGRTVSLFERECSIQRRHQKIIEESPSPAVSQELREQMGAAAVEAAQSVGYVGAGTVEFLFMNDQFWFLEMNTRLQVEHPVTEMVTGLDLVELQLLTADGIDLPASVWEPTITGHAIEARLYAEDPSNGYLPVTGTLDRFDIPAWVRTDSGVTSGSEVSVHYDPMLAKIIAHGPDRASAAHSLASALRAASVAGMATNRNLLVGVLEHPEFAAGNTDTHFLERIPLSDLDRPLLDSPAMDAAVTAAALDLSTRRDRERTVLASIPSGWRNNPSAMQHVAFSTPGDQEIAVSYMALGSGRYEIGEVRTPAIFVPGNPASLDINGAVTHPTISWTDTTAHIQTPAGSVDLTLVPRFAGVESDLVAGSLVSPMPGKVLDVLVQAGANVSAGQALIVMEAMKMEHTLRSPVDGTVESVAVAVGDQVEGNVILAVVTGHEA